MAGADREREYVQSIASGRLIASRHFSIEFIVKRIFQTDVTVQMSVVDLVVLLLCVSGASGSLCARRCKGLLLSLLANTGVHGTAFPTAEIVEVLGFGRQHEVSYKVSVMRLLYSCNNVNCIVLRTQMWSRLHAPIWSLCVWLLEQLPSLQHTMHQFTAAAASVGSLTGAGAASSGSSGSSSSSSSAFVHAADVNTAPASETTHTVGYETLLALLVSKLFGAAPSLREAVVSHLVALCFPQVHHAADVHGDGKSAGGVRSPAGRGVSSTTLAIPLPALGTAHAALSHTTSYRSTTYTEARLLRRSTYRTQTLTKQALYAKASGASSVLLSLSGVSSVVGERLCRAVYERVTQQLSENAKIFPSPAVCLRSKL